MAGMPTSTICFYLPPSKKTKKEDAVRHNTTQNKLKEGFPCKSNDREAGRSKPEFKGNVSLHTLPRIVRAARSQAWTQIQESFQV
jgi:hypothetical protein